MAGTITHGDLQIHGGGGSGRFPLDGFGDFGPGGGLPPGTARRVVRTGMWLALLAISMVFVALTSAYIVRSGLGEDWTAIGLPPVLWWNAAVLLLSSLTMEKTRQGLNRGLRASSNLWVSATAILGGLFLLGQYLAWRQLAGQGIYLTTNPSSSFFYLLTAMHGLHLLGGLVAIAYIALGAWRYRLGPAKRTLVEVTAIYWHFMDGLWIYILMLIWWWR